MQKILIIEDDEAISQALRMALELEGYEINTVLKAEETLKALKSFKPDIILLDLLLSGSDGRQIAKVIRAHKPSVKTPIILLSAHPTAGAVAKEIGVNDFIAKPFDTDELVKKIKKLI